MSIAVFDIETPYIPAEGILALQEIFCIAVKVDDNPTKLFTPRPLSYSDGSLQDALDLINSCDYYAAHNGIAFDLPVTELLLGEITAQPIDTMVLAKLIYTKDELISLDMSILDFPKDKYGSFSLDAFGHRIGEHKQSFHDFSELTETMAEYCVQDVEVTYHLLHNLQEHPRYPNQSVIDLEYEVAYIVAQQTYYGFYFDIDKARELNTKLLYEKLSIETRLKKTFKAKFLPQEKPITPAGARRNKMYLPDTHYKGF